MKKSSELMFGYLKLFLTKKNKRGWMRILEATIAVLIVSGVLITVYSNQLVRTDDMGEYFHSLGRQILSDISLRSDLRINVLNVDNTEPDDNYTIIYEFIEARIPDFANFSISICNLGDLTDNCKMEGDVFISTVGKDIYAEDIIISSDLGVGSDAIYAPRKLRLFMWQN